MAFGKKELAFVDLEDAGNGKQKPKAYDLVAWFVSCGMKAPAAQAKLDAYREAKRKADAMLASLMAEAEKAGEQRGLLDSSMALAPYFRFGNNNVVRHYGARHGVAKQAAPSNAINNMAELLAAMAPQSKLIAKRK